MQPVSLGDWTLSCPTLPRPQCAKCRESFHGSPLGGQQCYRLISVEQEYCLDPTSQTNCFHEPKRRALGPGRTVLFGVQPKFTNVDIRLTLDVTFGAVDLYVSTSYDTFVVRVAPDTGVHTVHIQPPPPPPPPPPPADGGPRDLGTRGDLGLEVGRLPQQSHECGRSGHGA